ncbi:hypothetical protein ACT3CE_13875 [Marinifilum sp. RC60d5]
MHEHRMAVLRSEIKIADPMVVNQSHPNFWEPLKEVVFKIEEK